MSVIVLPVKYRGIVVVVVIGPLAKVSLRYVRFSVDIAILEACVLTHVSTILSLVKYTCRDGLSCTVYVTNEYIVHQFMLLIFFWIAQALGNFKRKQTPAVHNIFFESHMK